jgi:hypothetical protein
VVTSRHDQESPIIGSHPDAGSHRAALVVHDKA